MSQSMNIIEHAELFLGKVSQGWKERLAFSGLQVVCFKNNPFESVDTFLTVGLSYHELEVSNVKKVRQELLFHLSSTGKAEIVVLFLLFICDLILKDHRALLRGQVIRFPTDMAQKLGFDAVYCAIPVFLEDDFATFNGSQPPTVIVWTIPIYTSEADYVDLNGWSKFEDLLEERSTDLFSFGRKPII